MNRARSKEGFEDSFPDIVQLPLELIQEFVQAISDTFLKIAEVQLCAQTAQFFFGLVLVGPMLGPGNGVQRILALDEAVPDGSRKGGVEN